MSCGRPRDFIIRTLPNSVRSRALHMSRLVCNFWSLWLKFIWLFSFSSYETWIPKIFTGLCDHFRRKGLFLFFPHLPNQIAFVFFRFSLKPASIPKLSAVSKAVLTEAKSAQNRFVSSAYWLNFSSFPNILCL